MAVQSASTTAELQSVFFPVCSSNAKAINITFYYRLLQAFGRQEQTVVCLLYKMPNNVYLTVVVRDF